VIGPDRLIAAMAAFFNTFRGRSASTATLEAFLIAATGAVPLVELFHRFVYGLEDQTPGPRLLAEIVDSRPGWDASVEVRVRNVGAAQCRHFVVVITGAHPRRDGPPVAAVARFDLAANSSTTLTVPLSRSGTVALTRRLEASVHARGDGRSRELRAHPTVQLRRRA
jgi:hypothetical protein